MPRSLLTRLVVVTGLVLLVANGALLLQSNHQLTSAIERGERARLEAIATTLALALDGDEHERIVRSEPDQVDRWERAPLGLRLLQSQLATARQQNGLVTEIETLIVGNEEHVYGVPDRMWPEAMRVVASSREIVTFRATTAYRPAMARALAGESAVTAPYSDRFGTWVSAYGPIHDGRGAVVAIVQVDASLDMLLDAAERRTGQLALFSLTLLLITLAALVLAVAQLTRALTHLGVAAEAFGGGDFESPIQVSGRSTREVRMLAHALEGARRQIARHIRERSKVAEELALAVNRAEDAALAKSRFLANMSHELRTPMNAIIGYSEIMLEECEDIDAPELKPLVGDLEKIRRSAGQLLQLINEVLDLSKVEAGKMSVHASRFELRALAQELQETIEPLLEGNTLVIDMDEGPDEMMTDRMRLRQMLLNLLGNATKFTDAGEIRLRVVDEDDLVRFEVCDTGIGMSEEQQAVLFEPFTQVDNSSTRRYGGTGLGLALCKQFAELLGGSIEVSSVRGEGSCFTVMLPRGIARTRASEDHDAPPVLLVLGCDQPTVELVDRSAHRDGFEVRQRISDGDDAQIVLLDLDNASVEQRRVARSSDAYLVVVSEDDRRNESEALGADAFARKPVVPDAVRAWIAAAGRM